MQPFKNDDSITDWMLEGDVSIQFQVFRDLLGEQRKDLQDRIESEGWGAGFLSCRRDDGHWGQRFYQPKWTSTHYTLLDLKNLCIRPGNPLIRESALNVFRREKGPEGGISPSRAYNQGELCISGMALNYGSWFEVPEADMASVVDFILSQKMPDGGFNCNSNRSGARHSSMHTTISVVEGILQYRLSGYSYRVRELVEAEGGCREFMLQHRLFRSDKTGKVIQEGMTRLSYPCRWRYDILRALDYLAAAGAGYDPRMDDAIHILLKKRRPDGTWPLQARHPGASHLEMEQPGKPSRWNTLRAMRSLRLLSPSAFGS